MDAIIFWMILLVVFSGFIWAVVYKPQSEKEIEEKLHKSLEDEYIIDPETGAKLTLEEAESGKWLAHTNKFRTVSQEEIESMYDEKDKAEALTINYLKNQRTYHKHELTMHELAILTQTSIMKKYTDFTISDIFRFDPYGCRLLLVSVRLNAPTRHQGSFHQTQSVFWLRLKCDLGHHYIRQKSPSEKLVELMDPGDYLNIAGYATYTYEATSDTLMLYDIVRHFEGTTGLECEFLGDNLFIKNSKLVNAEDIKRIEEIIKEVAHHIEAF